MTNRRLQYAVREFTENTLYQYHVGLMHPADAARQLFVLLGMSANRVIELIGGEE